MDLPDEDSAALAKRRAIQALMKDKTLTPAERNIRMQAIIKGDFTDPGPPPAAAAASPTKSNASASQSSGSSDDESYSSSSSYTDDEDSYQGSTRTGRSGVSSTSGRGSRAMGQRKGSKSVASKSIGSGSGTGSGTAHSKNSSKVDPRHETSEHSTLSSATHGMDDSEVKQVELQKERQKKLLEIHRNSDLTKSQRARAMKAVMQTNVQKDAQARPRRAIKKMGSINESITIPQGFDESALQSVTHKSTRRMSNDDNMMSSVIEQLANDDPGLTELVLEKRGLGDEDVIPVFDVFGGNTHVTSMNMRINRIGNEGCSALASAILDNDSLTLIDLSGNNIGDEGVEDLCKVIPYNKTLTQLNMADNKLGDLSASELAGSLVDNTSLVHINLSGNFIGDEGAMNLFKVLATTNQTLESLLLRLNGITDVGASALASALIENETLLCIDLGHNIIGNKGAMDLLKVLSCNETIEEMKLDGNKNIDQEILDEIDQELTYESSEEESHSGSESGSEYTSGGDGDVDDLPMKTMEVDEDSVSSGESEIETETAATEAIAQVKKCEDQSDQENNTSAPTGGEAMLVDMPDEDNTALAKRKAVQVVMQDKSLSTVERNKKIQDIMAGRVELPKVASAKKPAAKKPDPTPPTEEEEVAVESAPTGGEAMLVDMPDEDNTALAKRKAVQVVMQDKSLSTVERNKKIQDIMAGRVELPKVTSAKKPAAKEPEAAPVQPKAPKEAPMKADAADPAGKVSKAKPKQSMFEMSDISLNPGQDFHRKDSHMSYDFGTPTAIAQDWKQWMMTIHPKAHDDLLDVLLAHKYRLSLKSAPMQSSFRVVAVVFFSRMLNGVRREERFHVVGSNDEPSSVAGSICAERSALMQLRFVLDLGEVTKIIITTDDVDPISPGMLCREFMSGFKQMSNSTPIILGRAVCRKCGLNLSGKTCGDAKGEFDPGNLNDVHEKIFEECGTKKGSKYPSPHDFVGSTTTLRDLFPYPSLYTGISAVDAFKFGQAYAASKPNHNPNEGTAPVLTNSIKSTRTTDSTVGSYRQERFDLSMISALSEDDPSSPPPAKTPNKKDPPSGSFTASLKTTVDFMRQIQEDGDDNQDANGTNEMTPGIIQHLTVKTLKISARLKPSQRREKLIRLATEASAMEIPHRRIHPIRYGAAVLFSDNTVAMASQKVALEYGCTLDAVGQLASSIDRKYLQNDEGSPAIKPVLIVQCDQFGIAHAPFAQGRSFLTERGYGDCKVLIHQRRNGKTSGDAESNDSETDLRLVEVMASELAPSPPDIFGSIIPKTHAQLDIEF